MKLYEYFIVNPVSENIEYDPFLSSLIRESVSIRVINEEEDKKEEPKTQQTPPEQQNTTNNTTQQTNPSANTQQTPPKQQDTGDTTTGNPQKEKSDMGFILKSLKKIAEFIMKYNPAKYIMLFMEKGAKGLAEILPSEKLKSLFLKVYEKLQSARKGLFEPVSGVSDENEGVVILGKRVAKKKVIGFIIASFSIAVVAGAIWKKIDEIKEKKNRNKEIEISNESLAYEEIDVTEYLITEEDVEGIDVSKLTPKSRIGSVKFMIRKYGETVSFSERLKDEVKKQFFRILATIIAAGVTLMILMLSYCLFFKICLRLDYYILNTRGKLDNISFDDYVKNIVCKNLDNSISIKNFGVFTSMFIAFCNVVGEGLKILQFAKKNLTHTLKDCLQCQ